MKSKAISANKINSHLFILSLAILNIIIAFDGYMYFAASTEIINYFHIETQQIDNITKANFSGILLGSFLLSAIINKYNKKHLLLFAMSIFIAAKISCVLTSNFQIVIISNFFSGIANSFPPTVIVLLLLQRYSDDLTNNKLLVLDMLVYAVSLMMPILTKYMIDHYGWRVSFIFPSTLGILSFITTYIFIHDLELPDKNTKENITTKTLCLKYFSLFKNIKFITFVLIACLPWITAILRQISIPILLNDEGVSLLKFTYAKEIIIIINIICAFMTIKLTNSKGLNFTTNTGFIALMTGVALFTISSYFENPRLIFFSTLVIVLGENLVVGFAVRAISSLDKVNQGLASSFIVMVGSILSIRATTFAQKFYDHEMLPNALVMLYYSAIAITLFTIVYYKDKQTNRS